VTGVPDGARLAVLGSPIAHSKSPALHRAAYEVLGLDWSYDAIEVAEGELAGFVETLDPEWRGLSLTMPLKREVLPLLTSRDTFVELAGVANTILLNHDGPHGFNTDPIGIFWAFMEAKRADLEDVHILGGGATAASVLVAARKMQVRRAVVSVRDPARAAPLREVADRMEIELVVRTLGVMDRSLHVPSAVISVLPGGVDAGMRFPEAVRRESVLLDIAYDPWPSALAREWTEAGGVVISGLSMLLHQALAQVRIFVNGGTDGVLVHQDRVLAAMRSAVGL
jgi:shikimate dehydrogenase